MFIKHYRLFDNSDYFFWYVPKLTCSKRNYFSLGMHRRMNTFNSAKIWYSKLIFDQISCESFWGWFLFLISQKNIPLIFNQEPIWLSKEEASEPNWQNLICFSARWIMILRGEISGPPILARLHKSYQLQWAYFSFSEFLVSDATIMFPRVNIRGESGGRQLPTQFLAE